MAFRDIKRRARRAVQQQMGVPVLYLATRTSKPLECNMRVHTKFGALGDMKGTSMSYAEREDIAPRVIIWRDEVPNPVRNAIISVETGEAYFIDHLMPPDDLTITALVVALTEDEAAGLPVPGDA